MSSGINTVGVIGAGVMGSAIAAHLAGAGINTHLLDIVPPNLGASEKNDESARNRFADAGLQRALKAKPALFYHADAARLVRTGNVDDHASRLADCDLVIEAVVEDLAAKRALFEKIAPALGPQTILASNTSGLSIARMSESLPAALRSRFLVMHFFNPVRYMKLLEIVRAPDTADDVMRRATAFGKYLGKGIVFGKDTTNFVANRIGVFGLMATIHAMVDDGLTIEEVDTLFGKPLGRPKSAVFNTCDLVGIDTMIHVSTNCFDSLPNDEERETFRIPEFVRQMANAGALGRKAGAGFYKKQGKDILVLDYAKGEYGALKKPRFDSIGAARKAATPGESIKTIVEADDRAGRFAWKVLSRTLCYAARRLGEIADDVVNVDRAMRWGFNWDLGPFEVWDAIGVRSSVSRMKKDGVAVPEWVDAMLASGRETFYEGAPAAKYYDPASGASAPVPADPQALTVAAIKARGSAVVKENAGASLVDLGDGVLGVEVHTKMNTVDGDVIAMMHDATTIAERDFRAIVIVNDGEHFGAGANLMMIVGAALQQKWDQVDGVIAGLQQALLRLRYARVPVVAAPCQYTLGGVAEVAMAADACQAYAETYMGLVEVGVGLLPAGGGCLRMVDRFTSDLRTIDGADLLVAVGQASLNIAMAKTSTSAEEARDLRYLLPTDGITLNRDHLLSHAKARAIGLAASGYRPPRPLLLAAAGHDAAKTIGARIWGMVEGGWASEHDAVIANKVAHVLCGGTVAAGTVLGEQHYLDLEREAFLSLCGEAKTHARIQHMLETGKPLRN